MANVLTLCWKYLRALLLIYPSRLLDFEWVASG